MSSRGFMRITALFLVVVFLVPAAARAADPEAVRPKRKVVDLNRATVEDLISLPGIGPAKAEAIMEYRKSHGPFSKVEDLLAVQGIGAKLLERIRPRITVSSAGPDLPEPRR